MGGPPCRSNRSQCRQTHAARRAGPGGHAPGRCRRGAPPATTCSRSPSPTSSPGRRCDERPRPVARGAARGDARAVAADRRAPSHLSVVDGQHRVAAATRLGLSRVRPSSSTVRPTTPTSSSYAATWATACRSTSTSVAPRCAGSSGPTRAIGPQHRRALWRVPKTWHGCPTSSAPGVVDRCHPRRPRRRARPVDAADRTDRHRPGGTAIAGSPPAGRSSPVTATTCARLGTVDAGPPDTARGPDVDHHARHLRERNAHRPVRTTPPSRRRRTQRRFDATTVDDSMAGAHGRAVSRTRVTDGASPGHFSACSLALAHGSSTRCCACGVLAPWKHRPRPLGTTRHAIPIDRRSSWRRPARS